ncbi:MAG TPA: hypothetical protein VKE96_17445 [Vicinamibacterales bacterium]|nr:hypothetical protein [Vicinamibacterales bacterium]
MSSSDFVVLRGGLALPLPVIRLALELESRGLHMRADGDMVVIGPKELLTDADRDAIRTWKPHLLALLEYNPDAYGGPQ